MPSTFILVFLGLMIYIGFKRTNKGQKFLRKFPGPRRYPVIGNIWWFHNPETLFSDLIELREKYGNRISIVGGSKKYILLSHPDDIGKILASKEMNKSSIYETIFEDWLGPNSLFYAKGKEYFRQRKTLLPLFTYNQSMNFELNLNNHAKELIGILKKDQSKGVPTEIRWLFTLCSLNVITEYFVGKSMGCLTKSDHEYAFAVNTELKCLHKRCKSPWLWTKLTWKISKVGKKEEATRKYLHNFMNKIIQEHKMEFVKEKSKDLELVNCDNLDQEPKIKDPLVPLDHLIRAQFQGHSEFTDKYIRDMLNGAVFAGHDTVASSLIFTVFLLAAHPEEQGKVHAELDEVFGKDKNRNVESLDLPKLKYMECCIKESLRLYPPAIGTIRAPTKDFQLDENTIIPMGVEVINFSLMTHRIPEFFPEPEKFLPERFSAENCIGRHPYSFLAFSAGARNCLGQKIAIVEEKIILSHVLRNFVVELDSPKESMVPVGEMIFFPKNDLKIRFKLR